MMTKMAKAISSTRRTSPTQAYHVVHLQHSSDEKETHKQGIRKLKQLEM